MNTRPRTFRNLPLGIAAGLVWGLLGLVPAVDADGPPAPSPTVQEEPSSPPEAGDIQERGVTPKIAPFKAPRDSKVLPPSKQPGGDLPAKLCHPVTHMMTQCKCFNQGECQALSALFPNSCPPGSQHCEFVPMSRGAMPPLPPNLCGYQVPWTTTECSCHNATECQQLTLICPGSCPAGSQSCQCTPRQRR
jgi:hypothetical protein